ncbi:MAG: sulfotransferase family protein [Rhodobacteraceae bacterium]|nr:sulfotransferase family protein [Paracoccaceae bacterium]
MLLSLSHQFLFVHVPKTGGSSIRHALQPFARRKSGTLFRRALSNLPVQEHPGQVYLRTHDTAAWARQKLGREVYNNLYSFAVVRDPYARAISYYEYLRQNPKHPKHRQALQWSFGDYLRWVERKPCQRGQTQSSFLCDEKGQRLVMWVLQFESLNTEFGIINDLLGMQLQLPQKNTTAKLPMETYLQTDNRRLIEEIYAEDFDRFGYSMAA